MTNIFEILPHLNVKLCIVLPNERLKSFENTVLNEPSIHRLLRGKEIHYLVYTEVAQLLDMAQREELTTEAFFRTTRTSKIDNNSSTHCNG